MAHCKDCEKEAKHFDVDEVGYCDSHYIDFLKSRIDVLYGDCLALAKLAKSASGTPQYRNPLEVGRAIEVRDKYLP